MQIDPLVRAGPNHPWRRPYGLFSFPNSIKRSRKSGYTYRPIDKVTKQGEIK